MFQILVDFYSKYIKYFTIGGLTDNEIIVCLYLSSLQPPVQVKGLDGLLRTSLDLELDLQVSRTRQARLAQELRVLRELKTQLEKARQQGQRELPAWVQEDERFRILLKQAEKQVSDHPGMSSGSV